MTHQHFLSRSVPWKRLAILCLLAAASGCGPSGDNGEPVGASDWAVHTVCGSGNTVKGIDVSSWQSTIDWSGVAQSGIAYAFIRVSDGVNYPDSKFDANWKGAKANGIIRGVYQYFEPSQDATAQAQLLVDKLNAAGGFDHGDLSAVIDVETMGSQSAATVMSKVHTWLDYVESATQRRAIVYTGSYFWDDNGLDNTCSSYPLWTAHYTTNPCPLTSDSWAKWTFWQYTDSGSVSGISGGVDSDVFDGTASELQQFIAGLDLSPVQPDAGEPDTGTQGDSGTQGDAAQPDAPVVEPDAAQEASAPDAEQADAGADAAPQDAATDAEPPWVDATFPTETRGDVASDSPCSCSAVGRGRGSSRGTAVLAVLAIAAALSRARRRSPGVSRLSSGEAA